MATGNSLCNTKYSLKMHAFSLESKMVTSFSTMGGIDEELSRPHTLLMIDHHFLQLISGLLKSLSTLSSASPKLLELFRKCSVFQLLGLPCTIILHETALFESNL